MSDIIYSTLHESSAEFYRTTPFEFDSSAVSFSCPVVVTTTIAGPSGNWVDIAGPAAPAIEPREPLQLEKADRAE